MNLLNLYQILQFDTKVKYKIILSKQKYNLQSEIKSSANFENQFRRNFDLNS